MSFHPLASDLSGLSDDELHKKRGELNSRISFAYKMGHGEMISQLQMLLGNYNEEVQVRNFKMLEAMQKDGSKYADKIDIAK